MKMKPKEKIEFEDNHFIHTNRTIGENALTLFGKGFVTGGAISVFPLSKLAERTPPIVLACKSLFKFALPGGVAGAICAIITSTLDEVNGKDGVLKGVLNAAAGGAGAGLSLAANARKPWLGFRTVLSLGALAGLLRFCITYEPTLAKYPLSEAEKRHSEVYISKIRHLGPQS